jgi:hypothetical protein
MKSVRSLRMLLGQRYTRIRTAEGNVVATLELLLGIEHLLAGGAGGGAEATSGASSAKEELLLAAILLGEVCTLEGGVAVCVGQSVELELVDARGGCGEREDEEGEGGEEHGGRLGTWLRFPRLLNHTGDVTWQPHHSSSPPAMTARASRRAAQFDFSSLRNIECLLIAQAAHEYGAVQSSWSAISKLMAKHALVSRPKNFFTPTVSVTDS